MIHPFLHPTVPPPGRPPLSSAGPGNVDAEPAAPSITQAILDDSRYLLTSLKLTSYSFLLNVSLDYHWMISPQLKWTQGETTRVKTPWGSLGHEAMKFRMDWY